MNMAILRRRVPALIGSIGLAMAGAAYAQIGAQLPSGSYAVDSARSNVTSKVSYFGLSSMAVTFPQVSGTLAYDARMPQAIKLDVNVDAATLNGGSNWNNEKLKGTDFFNVKAYPTILFRGERLAFTSAKTATVEGNMIVRGITKPSTLTVTFNSSPADIARTGRVALAAKTKIKRSQFGMTAYSMVVGEDVSLNINVEFVKR
jgi:polyisoprenoid-binding protein YceI